MANGLGVAWWARVETHAPHVIYWFGPFVRRQELEAELPVFLADRAQEAPGSLEHELPAHPPRRTPHRRPGAWLIASLQRKAGADGDRRVA